MAKVLFRSRQVLGGQNIFFNVRPENITRDVLSYSHPLQETAVASAIIELDVNSLQSYLVIVEPSSRVQFRSQVLAQWSFGT